MWHTEGSSNHLLSFFARASFSKHFLLAFFQMDLWKNKQTLIYETLRLVCLVKKNDSQIKIPFSSNNHVSQHNIWLSLHSNTLFSFSFIFISCSFVTGHKCGWWGQRAGLWNHGAHPDWAHSAHTQEGRHPVAIPLPAALRLRLQLVFFWEWSSLSDRAGYVLCIIINSVYL